MIRRRVSQVADRSAVIPYRPIYLPIPTLTLCINQKKMLLLVVMQVESQNPIKNLTYSIYSTPYLFNSPANALVPYPSVTAHIIASRAPVTQQSFN
jgi:hypothetical protein